MCSNCRGELTIRSWKLKGFLRAPQYISYLVWVQIFTYSLLTCSSFCTLYQFKAWNHFVADAGQIYFWLGTTQFWPDKYCILINPPPSRKQVYLLCFYCNAAFNSIKVYIKPELSVKFFFTFINNKTKCLAIQTIHWLNDCCDSHLSRWLIRMILSYMLQTGTRLGKCLLAIVTLVWSTPSVSAHMTH